MCGLAGLLDLSGRTGSEDLETTLQEMTRTLRHRGPDDSGSWTDASSGIGLGLQRLAVIDLSPAGHQPMVSATGRYVLAFNGEIYNFKMLRRELEARGHAFRGHSDTEVILAAIEEWGLFAALGRFNGMFAIALWDAETRRLHLARDRVGEKPLYYGWTGRLFLFGSELKAMRAHPAFRSEIDRNALAAYLRHKYVPTPTSIYEGTHKLPPGTVLTVDRAGATTVPTPYWSASEVAERGMDHPFEGSVEEATDALQSLLLDAVGLRMEADVPLGAFLSGGVDSSTVVALMQAQSAQPIRTFTIGFRDETYDEAPRASAVAAHLGTDHTELYVTPEQALQVIPRLPDLYDEPFADSSQIPTFLVSEMARRDVTVSLSGDGGDEVFGGYNRHFWAPVVWSRVGWMPAAVRRAGARALTSMSPRGWDRMLGGAGVPARFRQPNAGEKVHKLAAVLGADGPDAMYRSLVSHWREPAGIVIGADEPFAAASGGNGAQKGGSEFARRMMFLDLVTYLPDDILTKLDRATMSVSLEGRVPYLDHRVVEFAWRIPSSMHLGDRRGKLLLRRVLNRFVPDELIDRPKWGFGMPIGSWLRGPLRDWAEELLDGRRLRQEGFFDPRPIRTKWDQHLAGRRNWQYDLWDVLMFQSWLEASRRREAPVA
jgi:asparagine synthase (glutamine-hydrolysing)